MFAEKVKESILIGTLNIALPTADVYSDGAFIYQLYRGIPYHPLCVREENLTHFDISTYLRISLNQTCLQGIPIDELQHENHPVWASLLLAPFMLSYLMAWFSWYQIDKRKHFTWLACLFNFYPQFRVSEFGQLTSAMMVAGARQKP